MVGRSRSGGRSALDTSRRVDPEISDVSNIWTLHLRGGLGTFVCRSGIEGR